MSGPGAAGALDRSRVAFGCCPLGGHGWSDTDVGETSRAIRAAFDQDVTTFDVADVYGLGLAETRLSAALGRSRADARIVTKVGLRWRAGGDVVRDGSPAYLRAAVDASLRRLRLDAVPVVLLHWPDPAVPVLDSLDALETLRRDGKVLAYGASNLTHTPRALPWTQHHVSLLTGRLPPERRGTDRSMAWGALEQGLLAGEARARAELDPADRRQRLPLWEHGSRVRVEPLIRLLQSSAAETGTSPMALAVRWVLDRAGVDMVAVGIKSRRQLAELLRGAGRPVDSACLDRLAVEAERTRHRTGRSHDTCG